MAILRQFSDIVAFFNDHIAKMGYYLLLNSHTLTTSYVAVSLYNSRKLSDYDLIVINGHNGGWVVGTICIPVSYFTGFTGVAPIWKYNGSDIEFDIKYKSDTQLEVKYISSASVTPKIDVFGLIIE